MMKKNEKKNTSSRKNEVNAVEMVAAYDKLNQLREEYPELAAEVNPKSRRKTVLERLLGFYLAVHERFYRENAVNRKTYLWLHLLGIIGIHHFYSRHWIKGLLYIATCWTGISVGMTVIDWMAAFPKAADENGMIIV